MSVTLRSPTTDELPALRRIERLAGERVRDVGLPEVADDDPPSLDMLAWALDRPFVTRRPPRPRSREAGVHALGSHRLQRAGWPRD
jgi:hypothetical protein